MSHVTHEWVISHMNESCHLRLSHVTYSWVVAHMDLKHAPKHSVITTTLTLPTTTTLFTTTIVAAEVVLSHVIHMRESCHTYEGVISHVWVIHVWDRSHVSVTSHIWMNSRSTSAAATTNFTSIPSPNIFLCAPLYHCTAEHFVFFCRTFSFFHPPIPIFFPPLYYCPTSTHAYTCVSEKSQNGAHDSRFAV